jgi:homocysteine S-methyltransferase
MGNALRGGLRENLLLNDSGLETTIVYHEGRDLPAFAAFPLIEEPEGRDWLRRYYERHLEVAQRFGMGFVLDTPTWRANTDWGAELGYDSLQLARINEESVRFCREIASAWEERITPVLVSGAIGPRGDGYLAGNATADEYEAYHAPQLAAFARAGADVASAYTLSTAEEAIGVVRAARQVALRVAVSFTVETDGRLASGATLSEAIDAVDRETSAYADYFMVNCAHPSHFEHLFDSSPPWLARIGGIKANASALSHAELDVMTELDDGDPDALGASYRAMAANLPRLRVVGGCCGTDHRHIEAIARHMRLDQETAKA